MVKVKIFTLTDQINIDDGVPLYLPVYPWI